MASIWEAALVLVDSNELTSRITLKMGSIALADFGAEATEARSRLTDYVTALKAVTDANILSSTLRALNEGGVDGTVPATVAGVDNEAVILAHTNDAVYPDELSTIRIPNPVDGVFVNGNPQEGVDPADADLQALVAMYSSDFQFSDGEHVNTAEGTAGISSGFWRSVAKKHS